METPSHLENDFNTSQLLLSIHNETPGDLTEPLNLALV